MKTKIEFENHWIEFDVSTNPEFSLNSGWNKLTDLYLFSSVRHEHKITEELWQAIMNKYLPERIEITVAAGVIIFHIFNPEYI